MDLGGTDEAGDSLPWNTAADGAATALGDGHHTITVVGLHGDTEVAWATAGFTVVNEPTPAEELVYLSWTGDTATTMTLVWRSDGPDQLRWSPAETGVWTHATGAPKESGVNDGSLRVVEITELPPGQSYDYQIDRGGPWSPIRTFTAGPDEQGTFDLLYFADTGLSGRLDGLGVGVLQSIDAMNEIGADLLLPGGDYAYNATLACEPSDSRFDADDTDHTGLNQAIDYWFLQMAPLIGETPMMPTYGNHEVILCESFPEWADRFETPTGVAGPTPGPNGIPGVDSPPPVGERGNYSFDVGPVHFISFTAVRDNSGIETQQLEWLEADIAAAIQAGATWIVPYFHGTPVSHGDNHFRNNGLRDQLAPIFEHYGVHLALFSRDQSYARTYPLTGLAGSNNPNVTSTDTCYTENDGVMWLKTSPAGKHSNKNRGFSPWRQTPPSRVAESDNTMHHFTRVTVSPDELWVRTYAHDGLGPDALVIDEFRITNGSC